MKEKCHRCQSSESIPTFQFVKFDGSVNYLCGDCWELFRRWFFHAEKIEKDGEKE
jgi:hypothetical protein